jgi:hypothetical protein
VNSAKTDAARYDRQKNAFIVELAKRKYWSKKRFQQEASCPP